ncbi:minor tail protein [Bacillus phage Slash]|uniref:Tailspike protein n=1 Tax=Bacillus phage Slash TaxID=1406790 RepID=U5PWF8_9CAUD|nr:minor tail protein [Bacillus phage Slash]AGY48335.1 tailspike protein [Bacillus phage Slash]
MAELKVYNVALDTINDIRNKIFSFNQNDVNVAKIIATLTQKGKPIILTGAKVRFAFLKKDGKRVYQNATITDPTKSIVEVLLDQQVLALPKRVKGEIEIYFDGTQQNLVTEPFEFNVDRSILSTESIESSDLFPIIQQLESKLNKENTFGIVDITDYNVVGNGIEEGMNIQTALNKISTDFKKAIVRFPYANGTYKSNIALTVPNNVQIEGIFQPVLDFSGAPSNVKALTVKGSRSKVSGIDLKGNGYSGTTSVGLDIYGDNHEFKSIDLRNFNMGIDIAHSNTYILSFDKIRFFDMGTCLYADLVARSTPEAPIKNSGERIEFTRSVFCNSQLAIRADFSALDIYISHSSIDYCNEFFSFGKGIFNFSQCHLENALDAPERGWRANVDYFLHTTEAATINFDNCLFDLFQMHRIVSANSTLGKVFYRNCRAYFRDVNGVDRNLHSEEPVYVNVGATSATIYSPYISPITWPSVIGASNTDKKQIPMNLTVSNNVTDCILTVNFPAAAERTWIRITH